MNRTYPKILRNRKQRIARRLDPKRRCSEQPEPMMSASNIHFEMAERSQALNYGGIGAIHLMGQRLGLAQEIDGRLQLLKRHLPYHESDHVLNLAYNALLDGQRLEDIELRRNDEAFLDGLGAQRIPDPTTSGDFTRRFNEDSVLRLMEAINATRQRVWEKQPGDLLWHAFIEKIVALANERCDQENVIEQLKNGVNAMRMPVDDLLSNWAYMVMSALAWNLKAWYGLLMPNRQRGQELLRMEFRRFLHLIVMLPAQIVRSGRRIIYRIMGYNDWLKDFFATWEYLRRMAPA